MQWLVMFLIWDIFIDLEVQATEVQLLILLISTNQLLYSILILISFNNEINNDGKIQNLMI